MKPWLAQQAHLQPDKVFIDNGSERLSFSSCYSKAKKLAYVLKEYDLRRVGLYIDNSIESVILINAAWLAGIEIAMINTRLTKDEILNQMKSVEIQTILKTKPLQLNNIRLLDYNDITKQTSKKMYETTSDPEQIASIMFTSGTTGPQKAVPQTFENHYASALGCEESLGFDRHTVWLSVLPIYHISGLSVIIRALIKGFTVRLERKFQTQRMLNIIQSEGPTHISLVPQTLQWLMDAGLNQPYSIEKILLGGAKLSRQLIEQALDRQLPIYNSFGMTETCSQFLTASPSMLKCRPDTVGQPSENVQVTIKRPNKDGHGELLIKGKNVMDGYLYPSHLSDTFEDGYFKTGDIAEIDNKGYIMVYDRRKDLIISGGENIYPYQIESVARAYSNVIDAMCIGVEDEVWGQVPKLFVIVQKGYNELQFREYLTVHLAKYKVPKKIQVVEELPYTSTGKLQRSYFKG
ncbi:o-succinylbenzoate--CoA ligase [Staphylococcus sp. SQ8-PEA]|uniref:2-succinylbenzoate--CoA ligase n=1 Tax=Staphylococcus marylandisciuri TaxID=2981529 RepID=A0ABT2QS57_9STAP|nr:o-succinylbenzoate--CoA ligase [Staphylococcus marylandisciuri]MCU5746819.1 o-succinylbenzoate--CoA ligase [Staphylococcus marylandisciuri]